VEIYVTDDTIGRHFRRYQLALRMVSHGARSQTVCDWSGLTRDQLVTLRRRWRFDPVMRRRGPAPSSAHIFFKSNRGRDEAALFAGVFRILGATSAQTGADSSARRPCLDAGEHLCEAYEAFREWQPGVDLRFEHAVLLATSVAHANTIALAHCLLCHGSILIDRLGAKRTTCGYCE
jgi:hypothetical protein